MKEFIVRKQVRIKAEPSEVWNALTNPEKTKKYFFNCEVYSDWEVGSTILFTGTVFLIRKIEMKGIILKIEPNKLLQYSLTNEDDKDDSNFSTVTDELSYKNGETILSITDNVGQGEGAEDRYKRSEEGWDKILEGLKEVVEEDK
ncbi:SRPBCC family protein [Spirosoma validum]|uniref:SRPBCC domain-containing protein n=1 Tax=Spirosoma validum TaxID=2771355 RepID=A0A927B4H3_9BACT|nr:SRPBCC domain-containing protein [Spirosoma validum]MBD2755479.1 SRPBCC domain-containing protein [Spirosoma validum]